MTIYPYQSPKQKTSNMKHIKQLFKKHRESREYILDRSNIVYQWQAQQISDNRLMAGAIAGTLFGLYLISRL